MNNVFKLSWHWSDGMTLTDENGVLIEFGKRKGQTQAHEMALALHALRQRGNKVVSVVPIADRGSEFWIITEKT